MSKLHDAYAERYELDFQGLLAGIRAKFAAQIVPVLKEHRVARVLDMGVGAGGALAVVEENAPDLELFANDISPAMIEIAKRRLRSPTTFVCDDVAHITSHFPSTFFDLALCHLLFAYVDPDQALSAAKTLLKPGGLLSVITTTQETFHGVFEGPRSIAKKVFRVDDILARAGNPVSHGDWLARLERAGFTIVAQEHLQHPLVFKDRDDVWDFGVRQGWLISAVNNPWKLAFARVASRAIELMNPRVYPVALTADVSLVIARA